MASASKFGTKQIEIDSYGVPVGIDTSTFFHNIPLEIKAAVPLFKQIGIDVIKKCIENILLVLSSEKTSSSSKSQEEDYIKFQRSLMSDADTFSILYTALHEIIATIVKTKISLTKASTDLKKLNIPGPVADAICKSITVATRKPMEIVSKAASTELPRLLHMRWRVDVSISSGSLARVMRPVILVQVCVSPLIHSCKLQFYIFFYFYLFSYLYYTCVFIVYYDNGSYAYL